MRASRKLIYSLVFAVAILILSMFVNFIPCQTAPIVPNPQYTWKLCNQNPDSAVTLGLDKKYFGYTPSLMYSYAITLVLAFIVCLLVLSFFTRKSKE